jgi:hypothetical protein
MKVLKQASARLKAFRNRVIATTIVATTTNQDALIVAMRKIIATAEPLVVLYSLVHIRKL